MTATIEHNSIVYSKFDNYLIVGINNTNAHNAIASGKTLTGEIIIPYAVNNIPVKAIGMCAFHATSNIITSVKIEAKIVYIYKRAFSNMYYLERINIPNTVVYIGAFGIDFYDASSSSPGKGTVIIEFEQGSKLSFIDEYGITQKESIIIFFCETKAPKFVDYVYQDSKVTIYSPTRINFAGVLSIRKRTHCSCVIMNTKKSKSQFYFFISFTIFICSS